VCSPAACSPGTGAPDRVLTAGDFRGHSPRFQGENLTRNLALVDALGEVARTHGVTAAQLAIAWVLRRGTDVVPLVGARRRDRLAEALGALDLELDAADLAAVEGAVPAGSAAGERYSPVLMAQLDSERSSA
jgi:aryl-alcohol dehydrogenase-like predicted oxidoreductase